MTKLLSKVWQRLRRPVIWDLEAYFHFRCHLTADNLSNQTPTGQLPAGLEFRELTREDTTLLTSLMAMLNDPDAKRPQQTTLEGLGKRFDDGDRCFVIADGDTIAGVRWASLTTGRLSQGFAAYVRGAANSRVGNDSYIAPDYRGHSLQRHLISYSNHRLYEDGIETVYGFVGVHNFASVINNLRLYDEYKVLYHLRVDVPLLPIGNFYPGHYKEPWRPCPPSPRK